MRSPRIHPCHVLKLNAKHLCLLNSSFFLSFDCVFICALMHNAHNEFAIDLSERSIQGRYYCCHRVPIHFVCNASLDMYLCYNTTRVCCFRLLLLLLLLLLFAGAAFVATYTQYTQRAQMCCFSPKVFIGFALRKLVTHFAFN